MTNPTRRAVLSILAATTPAALGHAAVAAPVGKVEAVRGEAFALVAASRRTLAPSGDVFVGEEVATGAKSALAMRLGAATSVRLGADTKLRIDRYLVDVGGVLQLGTGAMVFDRDETAAKIDVAVRSPFGLIAVRGTRFFAGPSAGVFGVFVERGVVTVVGANIAVELGAGLGTDLTAQGAEPTMPHLWSAARVAAAFASVE